LVPRREIMRDQRHAPSTDFFTGSLRVGRIRRSASTRADGCTPAEEVGLHHLSSGKDGFPICAADEVDDSFQADEPASLKSISSFGHRSFYQSFNAGRTLQLIAFGMEAAGVLALRRQHSRADSSPIPGGRSTGSRINERALRCFHRHLHLYPF